MRISGTHTPATVLKAVEERTVNKVCTLFSSIIVIFFFTFRLYPFDSHTDCQ